MSDNQIIRVPVAPGELIDKITILQIKSERISDTSKLKNILRELNALTDEQRLHMIETEDSKSLTTKLKSVNERIWDLEDTIRECERQQDFGNLFLQTAKLIYRTNDERAAIKRQISILFGSQIVEEKSYAEY